MEIRAYIYEEKTKSSGIKATMKTGKHTVPKNRLTWQNIINFWEKKRKERERETNHLGFLPCLKTYSFVLQHIMELHKILPFHYLRRFVHILIAVIIGEKIIQVFYSLPENCIAALSC